MVHKKRPVLISIVAGWLILCSAVGAIVFVATIPRVETIRTDGEQAEWIVEHLGRGGLLAVSLVVYAFAGSMGFGLWRLRSWGRRALLATSVVLVAFSIVWGSMAIARTHQFSVDAVVNALVFGWPLYYFNRGNIKALFAPERKLPQT
jgi:hypothetical protein